MKNYCWIIWHDNGMKGKKGYTEYTQNEITEKWGSLEGFLEDCENHGVTVYSFERVILEE